mmetsp:Transcript_39704/g.40314  ORF Transcript_39704/g.40314 Transcript_39704/m.40314 type:complete len:199 (-) Transcript_39704:186-782(-)
MQRRVANRIADRVAERTSPSIMADRLSTRFIRVFPWKMQQMGVTLVANVVFAEGPYFVVQLQIYNFDMDTLESELEIDEIDYMNMTDDALEDMICSEEREPSEFEQTNINNSSVSDAKKGLVFGWLSWLLVTFMTTFCGKAHAHHKIPESLIQSRIALGLDSIVTDDIESETLTLLEAKQARYFYQNIKKIRSKKKER